MDPRTILLGLMPEFGCEGSSSAMAVTVPALLKEGNADRNVDEQISESTEQNEVRLLESLWSNLPEELILRIIAWLSIPDICRLRAVCKRWAFCLSPGPLAALQQQIVPCGARNLLMFIGSDPYNLTLFSPWLRKWYTVPLKFLPPSVMTHCLAANDSLICMLGESKGRRDHRHRRLYICNPFSQLLQMLPDVSTESWKILAVMSTTLSSSSAGHRGYKVLLVQSGCCKIFDSNNGFWRYAAAIPRGVRLEGDSKTPGSALCNKILYCRIHWPHGLLSFDMEREEWSMVRAGLPSCLFGTLHLADCEGKLVLAAELSLRGKRSFAVWRLDCKRDLWVQVDVMPDEIFKQFKRTNYIELECIGKGQFLILTANGDSRLMFNLDTKTWEWLPASPKLKAGFYPRFD